MVPRPPLEEPAESPLEPALLNDATDCKWSATLGERARGWAPFGEGERAPLRGVRLREGRCCGEAPRRPDWSPFGEPDEDDALLPFLDSGEDHVPDEDDAGVASSPRERVDGDRDAVAECAGGVDGGVCVDRVVLESDRAWPGLRDCPRRSNRSMPRMNPLDETFPTGVLPTVVPGTATGAARCGVAGLGVPGRDECKNEGVTGETSLEPLDPPYVYERCPPNAGETTATSTGTATRGPGVTAST